ncbi:MAG: amidohydrolase family protein [Kiritimatiellia bacterium]
MSQKNSNRIIDFHTHAFPDALAQRAMETLLAETSDVTAYLDGRLGSLLGSMERSGIYSSVVCSIATKPEQFEKILAWSKSIVTERIIPFPSVYPRDPQCVEHVRQVAACRLRGIKLHPYYQDFDMDDDLLVPLYATCTELGLIVVVHTGFDVAYPRVRRADPARIRNVLCRFPKLKLVATHLGAWQDWEAVDRLLIGKPIYMELSYSLPILGLERARAMLVRHPVEYVLFGTDSPWQDQQAAIENVRALGLGSAWERAVFYDNAARLLGL